MGCAKLWSNATANRALRIGTEEVSVSGKALAGAVCSEQIDRRGGRMEGCRQKSSLIGRFVFENKTTRKSVGTLPAKENEGIVVAVHRPRS
jgi:hypothetical protein